MKKIVLISIIIHAALLIALAPWLKTRMEFDAAEETKRTEEVRKRELARQEYERLKREKQKLDPELARKLKREAERVKQVKLKKKVDELRKLRDEIMDRQRDELAKLREREREDIIATAHITFKQQAEDLKEHVTHFTQNAMRRSLVVGAYQNGHGRGAKGLIDDVRIFTSALDSPFDSQHPAHRFPFDGNPGDSVTGKEGQLLQGGKLTDSPESGGEAFLGNENNARAEFWPINFGDAFTIVMKTRLEPKSELPQLLAANCHSGEYNNGFRFHVEPVEEGATSGHVVLSTSGGRDKGVETRSLPDSIKFGLWQEVAVVIDKTADSARIFIDGKDVTAPDADLAADLYSDGSTIDGSELKTAEAILNSIIDQPPTPENAADLMTQLEELETELDHRMEETPDLHDVRNEISESKKSVGEIKESLSALTPQTNLVQMNDTSDSVADKMNPLFVPEPAAAGELYNEAREIEEQIGEAYADVNAATRAAMENRSYSETRGETSASNPSRPDLANELSANSASANTVGGLDEHRRNLDRATSEVDDMTARARDLLGTVDNRSLTRTRSFPGSAFASNAARMSAASSQLGYGAVIDLAGFGEGSSEGMRGNFTGEGANMAAPDKAPQRINLNEQDIMKKALPGRRFTEKSLRRGWLYLDTWYVIGPWENHSAVNFDLKHQPEYEINFDARYTDGKYAAKEGHPYQVLTWKFYQSDSVRCQPPEVYGASTYYAYTEIWFEAARDMLIAVASDDAAGVWLNDEIIWQDRGQSVWQLGEGYRRVHFRRGYNKMLVRIENGPIHCVWSVLLCPPEILK